MEKYLVMLAGALGAACIEPAAAADPPPPPPYQRVCDDGGDCPGRKCLRLGSNAEQVPGVCSARCDVDADCGDGAACFDFGAGAGAGPSCLSLCNPGDRCAGGLSCTVVGAHGERACFARPPGRGPGA